MKNSILKALTIVLAVGMTSACQSTAITKDHQADRNAPGSWSSSKTKNSYERLIQRGGKYEKVVAKLRFYSDIWNERHGTPVQGQQLTADSPAYKKAKVFKKAGITASQYASLKQQVTYAGRNLTTPERMGSLYYKQELKKVQKAEAKLAPVEAKLEKAAASLGYDWMLINLSEGGTGGNGKADLNADLSDNYLRKEIRKYQLQLIDKGVDYQTQAELLAAHRRMYPFGN